MRSARGLLATAAIAASILASELSAQQPFWIQPFQAPASSFDEVLTSVQFSAIFGSGIRFDLFMLAPEFFQGPATLNTPSIWSQTVGTLNGELVSLPIGLSFAPGTFLGLGLTLPSDRTGLRLSSHDLCLFLGQPCEIDPATLPYVILRAQFPDGLYYTFGPQQMVSFSASWSEATTTPEPGTLVLVASGLLAVASFRRFKGRRESSVTAGTGHYPA